MITKKIFYAILAMIMISTYVQAQEVAGDPAEGEKIFTQRCTACHKPTSEKLIGPGLRGVDKRRPLEWIVKFVHNSEEVINSGDSYAVDLFEKFGKMKMTSNPDLSEAQIQNILAYLSSEEAKEQKKKEELANTSVVGAAERMIVKSDTIYKARGYEKSLTYSKAIVYFVTLVGLVLMVATIAWVFDREKEKKA